jgi:hypothetical protein
MSYSQFGWRPKWRCNTHEAQGGSAAQHDLELTPKPSANTTPLLLPLILLLLPRRHRLARLVQRHFLTDSDVVALGLSDALILCHSLECRTIAQSAHILPKDSCKYLRALMRPVARQLDVVLAVGARLVRGAAGEVAVVVAGGLAGGRGALVVNRGGAYAATGFIHGVRGDGRARGEVQACVTPGAAEGGELVAGGVHSRGDGGRKVGGDGSTLGRLCFEISVLGCVA